MTHTLPASPPRAPSIAVPTGDPAPAGSDTGCVFCAIADGKAAADVVHRWGDVVAIRPLRPVADGHLLVIPHSHVADVSADPAVSARAMACAAELTATLPAANVITSKGGAATQTVLHLHLHVVPRRHGDTLPLPWTPQQSTAPAEQEIPHA